MIEFNDQDRFDGQFVHGEIKGVGILKCVSGLRYEGEWQNSKVRHSVCNRQNLCYQLILKYLIMIHNNNNNLYSAISAMINAIYINNR